MKFNEFLHLLTDNDAGIKLLRDAFHRLLKQLPFTPDLDKIEVNSTDTVLREKGALITCAMGLFLPDGKFINHSIAIDVTAFIEPFGRVASPFKKFEINLLNSKISEARGWAGTTYKSVVEIKPVGVSFTTSLVEFMKYSDNIIALRAINNAEIAAVADVLRDTPYEHHPEGIDVHAIASRYARNKSAARKQIFLIHGGSLEDQLKALNNISTIKTGFENMTTPEPMSVQHFLDNHCKDKASFKIALVAAVAGWYERFYHLTSDFTNAFAMNYDAFGKMSVTNEKAYGFDVYTFTLPLINKLSVKINVSYNGNSQTIVSIDVWINTGEKLDYHHKEKDFTTQVRKATMEGASILNGIVSVISKSEMHGTEAGRETLRSRFGDGGAAMYDALSSLMTSAGILGEVSDETAHSKPIDSYTSPENQEDLSKLLKARHGDQVTSVEEFYKGWIKFLAEGTNDQPEQLVDKNFTIALVPTVVGSPSQLKIRKMLEETHKQNPGLGMHMCRMMTPFPLKVPKVSEEIIEKMREAVAKTRALAAAQKGSWYFLNHLESSRAEPTEKDSKPACGGLWAGETISMLDFMRKEFPIGPAAQEKGSCNGGFRRNEMITFTCTYQPKPAEPKLDNAKMLNNLAAITATAGAIADVKKESSLEEEANALKKLLAAGYLPLTHHYKNMRGTDTRSDMRDIWTADLTEYIRRVRAGEEQSGTTSIEKFQGFTIRRKY